MSVNIALKHKPSDSHEDVNVKIPYPLLGDRLVEPRHQIAGESGLGRCDGAPVERCGGTCPDQLAHEYSSSARQDLATAKCWLVHLCGSPRVVLAAHGPTEHHPVGSETRTGAYLWPGGMELPVHDRTIGS